MRPIKKWIATIICALLVGFTIVGKVFNSPQVVEQMELLGLQEEIFLLTMIEVIALLLYLIPRTFHLGFFMLTAYYGGAIAVNLNAPINTVPAVVFLIIIWILSYIRSPKLFFPDHGAQNT